MKLLRLIEIAANRKRQVSGRSTQMANGKWWGTTGGSPQLPGLVEPWTKLGPGNYIGLILKLIYKATVTKGFYE